MELCCGACPHSFPVLHPQRGRRISPSLRRLSPSLSVSSTTGALSLRFSSLFRFPGICSATREEISAYVSTLTGSKQEEEKANDENGMPSAEEELKEPDESPTVETEEKQAEDNGPVQAAEAVFQELTTEDLSGPPPLSESEVESSEDEAEEQDQFATVATEVSPMKPGASYEITSTGESAGNSEQNQDADLLSRLSFELGSEDSSAYLVYGAGALVALWLSSIVISVVDSIPLLPKVMELVGLGFSIWFSIRYLLFKENRDELVSKIENLKSQVLGSLDS